MKIMFPHVIMPMMVLKLVKNRFDAQKLVDFESENIKKINFEVNSDKSKTIIYSRCKDRIKQLKRLAPIKMNGDPFLNVMIIHHK